MDWDPPTDTPPEDIKGYIIRDSVNEVPEEINITSTLVSFPSSECTNNLSISITTVDRCGGEGPSSDVKPQFLQPSSVISNTIIPSSTLTTTTTTATTTATPTATPKVAGPTLAAVITSGELIGKDTTGWSRALILEINLFVFIKSLMCC